MIRAGRRPRDRSEHMILNNYRAMQAVRRIKDKPLTPGRVLELHATLTSDTLDDPEAAGRIQRPGTNGSGSSITATSGFCIPRRPRKSCPIGWTP